MSKINIEESTYDKYLKFRDWTKSQELHLDDVIHISIFEQIMIIHLIDLYLEYKGLIDHEDE